MATYTPAILIATAVLGSGATGPATWRKQNTGATGTFDIHRTTAFSSTGANNITVEAGTSGGDLVTQRITDAYVLATSVPSIFNWWQAIPGASYFFAWASTTGVNGTSSGLNFA